MLPDKNKVHTMTVEKFQRTAKTFFSQRVGCEVRKYKVTFVNGYEAEVLFPLDETPKGWDEGTDVTFRIGYRGEIADELNKVQPEPSYDYVNRSSTDGSSPKPESPAVRMTAPQEHPAAIALREAIRLKAIGGIPPREDSDVLATADMFYEWLTRKQSGEER